MGMTATKRFSGEHRLTVRLMGHWQMSRGNRRWPLVRDFTASVPPYLLSDCFSLLLAERIEDREVSFIGESFARASGITQKSLSWLDIPSDTLLGVAVKSSEEALKGVPIHDRGEFEDRIGKQNLYRAILLPLENDQGEIVQIMGGARCKAGHVAS
jgi:hypothetical protein